MIYTVNTGTGAVCTKIDFMGYEISIAQDDSCGAFNGVMQRSDVRLYKDNEDVTAEFGDFRWVSGEDIFKIMKMIENKVQGAE